MKFKLEFNRAKELHWWVMGPYQISKWGIDLIFMLPCSMYKWSSLILTWLPRNRTRWQVIISRPRNKATLGEHQPCKAITLPKTAYITLDEIFWRFVFPEIVQAIVQMLYSIVWHLNQVMQEM